MDRQTIDRETSGNTLPGLLHQRYRQWGEKRIALRQKEFGIWHEHTWTDCHHKSKSIALGLISLGINKGDIVGILGWSSPEWLWCELATQAAGGTALGLEAAGDAEEMKKLLDRFRAKILIVQDQEQVDKVLDIRSTLPWLQKIVYWRDKGLQHYRDPILLSLAGLIGAGESMEKSRPEEFEHRLSEGRETDVAIVVSSRIGNEGLKSWSVTHALLISSAKAALGRHPVGASDEYVCSATPSWFFEQVFGFAVSLLTGQRLNFAERADTLPMDFREISPQVVMYPADTWEMIGRGIQANMKGGSRLKRALYDLSFCSGRKYAISVTDGHLTGMPRPIPSRLTAPFFIRPLRDKHGFNRARVAYAAGGPLSQDVFRLFRALGIEVEPIFGSIEDGIAASQPPPESAIE